MLLKIRHALLEVTNQSAKQSIKQSAVIINNEIIIGSGSILQPYVHPCGYGEKIIQSLQQCKLVDAQDEQSGASELLRTLSYLVTFDRQRRPLTDRNAQPNSGQTTPHILTRYTAQPLYVFCAAEVSRNLHKILMNVDSDEQNVLRSSFVVLTMRALKERESFKRFIEHIANYLRYLQPIHTLDDVLVMCSPFGLEHFYKTISIGKVSNVMGSSLFGLSNALPLGCEGSAVFNNKLWVYSVCFYRKRLTDLSSFQAFDWRHHLHIVSAGTGKRQSDFVCQFRLLIT